MSAEQVNLTNREREVLDLVVEGLSDRQMGRRLHISHRTVQIHVQNLFAKAGVRNRTALSVWALRNPHSSPAPGALHGVGDPVLDVEEVARAWYTEQRGCTRGNTRDWASLTLRERHQVLEATRTTLRLMAATWQWRE